MIVLFRVGVNGSAELCWHTIATSSKRPSTVRLANVILLLLFQRFHWVPNSKVIQRCCFYVSSKATQRIFFFSSVVILCHIPFFINKLIHGVFSFLSLLGRVCLKYFFCLTMRNWWCLISRDFIMLISN